MGLTNFPYGITSFGVPITSNGSPMFATQGNVWFVKPISGSNGNTGTAPDKAFKTLSYALSMATASQNDIIYMFSENNTAGSTTDYQTSTLAWNKDMVHLIGVNAGGMTGSRSRVAFASTYATASNLITVSANGCLFYGIEFYAGVTSTNPTGCMSVTGMRNHFINCQISNAIDVAANYSLSIAGNENTWDNCIIGIDTVVLAACTQQIYVAANAAIARTVFRNCLIETYAGSTTTGMFLNIGALGLSRYIYFAGCLFENPIDQGASTLANAFTVASGAGGSVILDVNTGIFGVSKFLASSTGHVYVPAAFAAGTSDQLVLSTLTT